MEFSKIKDKEYLREVEEKHRDDMVRLKVEIMGVKKLNDKEKERYERIMESGKMKHKEEETKGKNGEEKGKMKQTN